MRGEGKGEVRGDGREEGRGQGREEVLSCKGVLDWSLRGAGRKGQRVAV